MFNTDLSNITMIIALLISNFTLLYLASPMSKHLHFNKIQRIGFAVLMIGQIFKLLNRLSVYYHDFDFLLAELPPLAILSDVGIAIICFSYINLIFFKRS